MRYGVEDGAVSQHTRRTSNACRDCEWIEKKPGYSNISAYSDKQKLESASYAAPVAKLLYLLPFLGDEYNFDAADSPEAAMSMSAFALKISTIIYTKYVKIGYVFESGSSENRGRSSGAW